MNLFGTYVLGNTLDESFINKQIQSIPKSVSKSFKNILSQYKKGLKSNLIKIG